MLNYARWKYVVILVVLLLSALYALPNIYPQDPSVQVTANRGAKVDRRRPSARASSAALKKAGVAPKSVELEDGNLLVRLREPRPADQGRRRAAREARQRLRRSR